MGVFWTEFLFHWSSWILFIVFTTIAMELNLMNHCACGIGTLELRSSLTFFPVDMQKQDSHFFHQPRSKCSCSYYSNSIALFHLPLVGDLVFKLNPEPVTNSTPRTASTLRSNNIHRNKSVLSSCNSLNMCLLNIQSLRNKTS